jgi:hypothetical protein
MGKKRDLKNRSTITKPNRCQGSKLDLSKSLMADLDQNKIKGLKLDFYKTYLFLIGVDTPEPKGHFPLVLLLLLSSLQPATPPRLQVSPGSDS